jgi:hypothetical protein
VTFGALGDATLITAPPYEWPTRMTGPGIDFKKAAMLAASAVRLRSGFGGAKTVYPPASNWGITAFQLDASAQAPCTRTIVGLELDIVAYLIFLLCTSCVSATANPTIALRTAERARTEII